MKHVARMMHVARTTPQMRGWPIQLRARVVNVSSLSPAALPNQPSLISRSGLAAQLSRSKYETIRQHEVQPEGDDDAGGIGGQIGHSRGHHDGKRSNVDCYAREGGQLRPQCTFGPIPTAQVLLSP